MRTSSLTLKHLMGHDLGKDSLDLGPIHKVLKPDEVPKLSLTPLGRLRLIRALRNRYGVNYRAIPGVSEAIEHFDSENRYAAAYRAQVNHKKGVK